MTSITCTASALVTHLVGRSFAGVVLSLLAASAFAQSTTPTFNVPASATVVTPLTIGSASTLNFGAFAPDALKVGTVMVTPAGVRSGTSVTLMATNTGGASTIVVAGSPDTMVKLDVPATAVTLVQNGGSSSMTMVKFTTNLVDNTRLLSTGTLSFQMGATLNVNAGQPVGIYTGSVPITVTYQ